MLFTVAICTRNRASSLKRTLSSLECAFKPKCEWELLIIDNGSTDGTQSVVAEFVGRLPIRCEIEKRSGLSNARNKAVACARGEYIIWTDDDVEVEHTWLTAYVEAFKRWPDVSIFGGKIVPTLVEPSVAWLSSILPIVGLPFAARDLGAKPISLTVEGNLIPYGANFAIRSFEQRQFLYDPRLGIAPGRRLLGEDTEVIKAVLAKGFRGMWLPECSVRHIIGHDRQSAQYISDYYGGHGATEVLLGGALPGVHIFGVPRWLWRRFVTRLARYWLSRLVSPPEVWVTSLMGLAHDRGKIKYLLSVRSCRSVAALGSDFLTTDLQNPPLAKS